MNFQDRVEKQGQISDWHSRIASNRNTLGNGLGIVILGYPASGKTTFAGKAAEKVNDNLDERLAWFNLQDSVRNEATKHGLDSNCHAVIEDIDSSEELVKLSAYFDLMQIVAISSHRLARHNRLIEKELSKDEPDEESVSYESLTKEDEIKGEKGLEKLFEHKYYDHSLTNNDSLDDFVEKSKKTTEKSIGYYKRIQKR